MAPGGIRLEGVWSRQLKQFCTSSSKATNLQRWISPEGAGAAPAGTEVLLMVELGCPHRQPKSPGQPAPLCINAKYSGLGNPRDRWL